MIILRKCLSSNFRLISQSRQIHLDVWQHTPKNVSSRSPTVVLFGYAGSPKKNLVKYEQLYSDLGYKSISTILPHSYTYEYDLEGIRGCATKVLDTIDKNGVDDIVVHTFSNNGVMMYQHLYYLLEEQNRLNMFKGLIMDSGPGPMGWRDNIFQKNYNDKQSLTFLTIMLFIVNIANRMSLRDNVAMTIKQMLNLRQNYKHEHIPFAGTFVTHHEKGDWPMLVLYSKQDAILPFNYLDRLLECKKSQNPDRKLLFNLFDGSGHVAHYKRFPNEYRSLVQNFLCSISSP